MRTLDRFYRILMILLPVLLTGFSLPAESAAVKPKVVLLTSVSVPETKLPILRQHYASYHKKLERTFRRKVNANVDRPSFEIVVKHAAAAIDLYETLQDPRVFGVYWISHAGATEGGADLITDIVSRDVRPVFQAAHPGLKFLAIVGCKSQFIIDRFKAEGYFASNPEIRLVGFEKKVPARKALRRALSQTYDLLESAGNYEIIDTLKRMEQERSGRVSIQVMRRSLLAVKQSFILMNGKLMGVLPSALEGSNDRFEMLLPKNFAQLEKSARKIVVDSGELIQDAGKTGELGEFEFKVAEQEQKWKLFSDRNGRPIGVTKNIYLPE